MRRLPKLQNDIFAARDVGEHQVNIHVALLTSFLQSLTKAAHRKINTINSSDVDGGKEGGTERERGGERARERGGGGRKEGEREREREREREQEYFFA